MLRRASSQTPLVTYALIISCVLVWGLQVIPGSVVSNLLAYVPYATAVQPWRMFTTGFVHDWSSPLHLLFNMYSLYIFGRGIEPLIGRIRYAALYFLALFGGSVGVLWLSPLDSWVVGASGAIFGLMAAYFVIARTLGGNTNQLVGVIAINLFLGFMVPNVAWQAHLGGLLVGGLVAYIYTRTRSVRAQKTQALLLVAVAAGLVVLTVIGATVKMVPGI